MLTEERTIEKADRVEYLEALADVAPGCSREAMFRITTLLGEQRFGAAFILMDRTNASLRTLYGSTPLYAQLLTSFDGFEVLHQGSDTPIVAVPKKQIPLMSSTERGFHQNEQTFDHLRTRGETLLSMLSVHFDNMRSSWKIPEDISRDYLILHHRVVNFLAGLYNIHAECEQEAFRCALFPENSTLTLPLVEELYQPERGTCGQLETEVNALGERTQALATMKKTGTLGEHAKARLAEIAAKFSRIYAILRLPFKGRSKGPSSPPGGNEPST
jgi:hypothetical protein